MMRKVGITLAAALSLAAVGTSTAAASEPLQAYGPCQTQQGLFEKYNIQFDMHQEQVEQAYSFVCSQTG
jgi:hypothetical protein